MEDCRVLTHDDPERTIDELLALTDEEEEEPARETSASPPQASEVSGR